MARNKKVEILSNDKEVLHPMTDGDCVIFEDGQTLTQKLSEDDSVKYTPEIVNSSPMFKVGEGNTVDYSDNVLDGAYERATLQGQTYTNYIQESSADEVTLPTPFTEYERTQHNTLTSNEEGTLGINLVGQSYVNALQHDSEEEFVVLGESLEFQEKKVEYTNEGQIKSAMLKGETLVNLVSHADMGCEGGIVQKEGDVYTLTTQPKNGSAYALLYSRNPHRFKTNTRYLLQVNVIENNLKTYFNPYIGHDSSIISFNEATTESVTMSYKPGETGIKTRIFTTKSDFTGVAYGLRGAAGSEVLPIVDNETIKFKFVFIEYQEGMENWDIPYFEGMQSVTVSTKLENLCHKYNSNVAKNGKTFTTNSSSDRILSLSDIDVGGADTVYGIKPNTKYLVQFKISNLVLDGLSSLSMQFSVSGAVSGNCLFIDGIKTRLITTNGIYRVILTTTDLVSTSGFEIKGVAEEWESSGSTSRSLTISNVMCIEYQNGMENWNLPYFEDYQVMQPVQVESINKNLCPVNKNDFYNIHFKAGTQFTLSTKDGVASQGGNIVFKDIDGNDMWMGIDAGATSKKYTISKDAYSIHNFLQSPDVISYQLEQGNTATSYVPHQSKTTYSWDEVILRKVGDVQDTLDLTTGEWVQRIGEIVLDSSIDKTKLERADGGAVTNGYRLISYPVPNIKTGDRFYAISDKFPTKGLSFNSETIFTETMNEPKFWVTLSLSKLTEDSFDAIYEYFCQNPVTVQYVLTKPIVHKVNLSRPNLQVYDDITHVHTKCLDGTLIPNIYLPSDISYPAILEPGKKYNICVNHTEVSADNPLKVNVGGTEITMTDSRMTLTTPATLANSNVSFTGKGNKIKESMLIKNSSLLTRDLPHFNGIGSVQLGKTIENLCSSSGMMVGGGAATITKSNDYVDVTMTKAGSCVFLFELLKVLEDGKNYFIYAPNTYPTTAQCYASFRGKTQGSLSYTNDVSKYGHEKYWILTINHKTDSPYSHLCLGQHGSVSVNANFRLQRPIICEYEPGMEDWDWESIGYFTGTKNIGNEFMKVQNKNLIDASKIVKGVTYNHGGFSEISEYGGRLTLRQKDAILVKPNSVYSVSISPSDFTMGYYLLDEDKNIIYDSGWTANPVSFLINRPNAKYLIFNLKKQSGEEIEVSDVTSIQLEESSTATTYTAHKHNGLYITKDQPINLTWEQGQVLVADFGDTYTSAINNTLSTRIRNKGLLNLKPNTTYRVSLGNKADYKYHIACFDNQDFAEHAITGIATGWVSSFDTIFTTTKDMHKISINVAKVGDGTITPSEINHIRLEEVTDVVLRSCSGKYDELDLTRGTYTQNVGMIYLNGVNQHSNYITVVGDSYQPTDTTLKTFDIRCDGAVVDSICLSNRFPMRESMASADINLESVRIHSTAASCRLTIKKEKASTVDEFKLWLQDNPLEIIYALKTPIVHKVHIGNKNEASKEVTKPNDVFTLPTLYTEQTHIDLTNNGIIPKVQSRDYIAYPVLPMISRTYTLQHNLTGGVSNLTVDLLGRTQEITYQQPKALIYSPESLVSNIKHHELRISGKGKISRVMYIDGGYMDRDIPYIEGMKNAVNPIVKNYTDTQENICYVDCGDKTIYLRSLPNGVHDEIDLEIGKYIQRVGEITFNGTENWIVGYSSWQNKYTYYNNSFVDIKTMKGDNGSGQAYYDAVRCPQLHRSYMGRLASALIDGVCSYYYSGYQRIFISKQDCATVDELKLWLKENPITVQYELPEPIVKDIVIHNYPHSYEDGHVIIENGNPNTPIPAQLTYRAVTNRSGQIQQHTEQVEKQEREINELETLILANIHLSQTR